MNENSAGPKRVKVNQVVALREGVRRAEKSVDHGFQMFRANGWQPHQSHAVMFR